MRYITETAAKWTFIAVNVMIGIVAVLMPFMTSLLTIIKDGRLIDLIADHSVLIREVAYTTAPYPTWIRLLPVALFLADCVVIMIVSAGRDTKTYR